MSRQTLSIHRCFVGQDSSAGRITPQQPHAPPRRLLLRQYAWRLRLGDDRGLVAVALERSRYRPRSPGRRRTPRTGSSAACETGYSRHRSRYTRSPKPPSGPGLQPTASFSYNSSLRTETSRLSTQPGTISNRPACVKRHFVIFAGVLVAIRADFCHCNKAAGEPVVTWVLRTEADRWNQTGSSGRSGWPPWHKMA